MEADVGCTTSPAWGTLDGAVRAVVAVVVCVLVVASSLVWFGQRRLVYLPDTTDPGAAVEHLAGGSDVELRTSDGLTLRAWRVDPVRPRGMAVL
jgi:hypothetical protein